MPWRSLALLAALVTATAVPAFLLVTASAWQEGAKNEIARRVVDEADLERSGVDIRLEVLFRAENLFEADELLRSEIDRLPANTEADLTLYTLPAGAESTSGQPIGTPLRIVARAGAQAQVRVLDAADEPDGGLWISDWYAERFGLDIGDDLRVEAGFVGDVAFNDVVPGLGRVERWTITAIYEAIWDEDGDAPDGYWSALPAEILPRYLRPLQAPSTALALADPAVLADSGLTGFARWRTTSTGLPDTLEGLTAHRGAYRAAETALVADGELSRALRSAGAAAGRNPSFSTDLYETVGTATLAADQIDAPMRSTVSLGLALAIGVVGAAGFFVVERRRGEFRLLAGEGDGPFRLGLRVAVQVVLPSVLGAGVAVGLGLLVGRVFGPGSGWAGATVPTVTVVALTAGAVCGIGLVSGVLGARTLTFDRRSSGATGAAIRAGVAAGLGATAWLWFQTAESAAGRVDLASISLPVAAFVTAGLLALAAIDQILRRVPRPRAHRRPTLLLGVRRVQAGAVPLRLTALAIGIGVGLVITSVTLVATFDRAVDTKLATQIGAETRWSLAASEPTADLDLPPNTALLAHQDTRVAPGGRPTRVVAIDPADLDGAVSWPSAFGLDPATAAALLAGGDGTFVPAIAIDGEGTPDTGAFGTMQPFPYRVVARAESLPLAGEFGATILISATAVDDLSERYHDELTRTEDALRLEEAQELAAEAAAAGTEFDIEEYLASRPTVPFIPATERFRTHIVSALGLADLRARLGDLEPREEFSSVARRNDADLVGVRLGFEFVRVVGAAALLLAFAALTLHIAARRRTAALSSVMARAVGLPPRAIIGGTVVEIATVVAATVGATALIAPIVVARLAERFEPLPDTPPGVTTRYDHLGMISAAIGVVAIASLAAALVERRDLARSPVEVLRHAA